MRADWVECTFDDVFELITNGSSIKQTDDKNGIPVSRIETIWNETIDWGRVKYAIDYDDNLHNKYLLKNGDILFSHINSDSHLGKTAIFRDVRKLIHGINLLLLRPFSILNSSYILYYLRFTKYRGGFLQIAQRSVNQSSINQRSLKQLIISIPPLPEQRAIVKKIEALFSSLDAGIADLKKAQEQLKIYRQAVLKKAFEGEFEEVKLKEITTKIGSGSTPKGGNSNYKTSGIPLIRSLNIHFDYIKFKDLAFIDDDQAEKLKNVIVYENDVLLNITGASIGRVNLAPKEFDGGRVNQHVSIIRLKEDKAIPKYFKYYIQSSKVQDYINDENYGVTRQALTKGMIEDLLVPAITLEEQAQIVKEIEVRLSVCDAVEQQIKDSLNQAEALRQSILKKAFEGKLLSEEEIQACQQEPDYEPAAVLLEKIKVEKEALKPVKKTKKK